MTLFCNILSPMAPCVTQNKSQTLQLPIILLFKRDHNIDINWQFVRNVNCRTKLPFVNLHCHKIPRWCVCTWFYRSADQQDLTRPILTLQSSSSTSFHSPLFSSLFHLLAIHQIHGKHFHLAVPLDWNTLPQVSLWLLPHFLLFFTQKSLSPN